MASVYKVLVSTTYCNIVYIVTSNSGNHKALCSVERFKKYLVCALDSKNICSFIDFDSLTLDSSLSRTTLIIRATHVFDGVAVRLTLPSGEGVWLGKDYFNTFTNKVPKGLIVP